LREGPYGRERVPCSEYSLFNWKAESLNHRGSRRVLGINVGILRLRFCFAFREAKSSLRMTSGKDE